MINIYKLKLTLLQQEVLRLLYKRVGKTFNARNIAKALEVSQPAISKALPLLEKEGLILVTKDKESKRLAIELKRENPLIIGLKRVDNLKQIYESGLWQFLYDGFPGSTVILFGSYSQGEDIITSDIDIAIIGSKQKNINMQNYEKKLERTININYYSSFEEIHKNLRNNILGGILLKGAIQL